MTPTLEVRGLVHRYGERRVLDGLTFAVAPGEVFGLLGPNGSGKSTAIAVVAGLLPRQGGEVLFEGEPMTTPPRAFRSRIGVVFQSPSLDPKLTVAQNVALAGVLHGLSGREARARGGALLERAGLAERAGDRVGVLSGGLRRRLDVARALLHAPSLLLMDEPTVGLDEASFRETWRGLDALRAGRGVSVLVATHRPEEAERCDRLGVIVRGALAVVDSPAGLRDRVRSDVVVLVGADPQDLAREVAARFGLSPLVDGDAVVIDCERGHELVPRLVEALPSGRLASVSLRRPTLADAFLKLTGTALSDDVEAAA